MTRSGGQTMIYEVEMTDTFAGEANYTWVIRDSIEATSHKQAITKFKKERGYGRHRKDFDMGDMVRVNIVGLCVCIFSRIN
jgi:uncharacterized protein (DUF4213/DUF364 family)